MTIRIVFGLMLIAAVTLLFTSRVDGLLRRNSALTWLEVLFAGVRLAGWVSSYALVPGLVRHSDLVLYYFPEATNAMQGGLPYRDFHTSYGPLFPYIAGAGLPLWNAHASIAFVMILMEITAVLVFSRFARRSSDADRHAMTKALYVYLLNPAALYWSGMMAYNSSVILFFWVLAIVLLYRGAYGLSLLAIGGSVFAGKILGVLAAPLWLVNPRRRFLPLLGIGVGSIVMLLVMREMDVDLLIPLQREGNRSTSGNVWFLLSGLVPFSTGALAWRFGPPAVLAAATACFMAALWSRWKQPPTLAQFCGATGAICWLFMIVSKKTLPHYLPMFVLFTAFSLARAFPRQRLWVILLALVAAAGLLEPGLWNGLRQPTFLRTVCTPTCVNQAILLIVADVLLIALSGYFCALCARVALARDAVA